MRPLPSENGWIITRFRWPIAAFTVAGMPSELSLRSSTSSAIKPGTRSASGPS